MVATIGLAARLAQLLALTHLCTAYGLFGDLSARVITRRQLATSYDYIVVGGGQSGLVIANRLSEDSTKTVLVVEYGIIDTAAAILEPSSATNYQARMLYNLTAVPQPGLNNAANSTVYAAAVVGGGSTVNGMMLDRASPEDYDNWGKLNNTGWSFADLLPYFKKAMQLTPPNAQLAADFNITYDLSAYGTNSPIKLSYPTYQYPGTKIQYQGMIQAGVAPQREGGLDGYGLFWFPGALDPVKVQRTYAVNEYYSPIASRSNLYLLTNYRVNEVVFNSAKRATGVTIQLRGSADGTGVQTISARQEIVLTAGYLHTPQILQRSGIGPASVLSGAGIQTVYQLDGVGSNFQDHASTSASFSFGTDVSPNPFSIYTNTTFRDWAQQLWTTNRTGPYSMGVGNIGAWVPLQVLAPSDWQSIISQYRAQNASQYLPSTYTAAQVQGYIAQRELAAASLGSLKSGVVEIPFSGSAGATLSLEHPFSRGTIRLNTNKYAEPLVDYNTYVNPLDPLVIARSYQFVRRWYNTTAMRQLSPTESSPGTSLTTDTQLVNAARSGTRASTAHGCCTAAMLPESLGGVVSPQLTVYGVTGLSIGDASIMPIVPAAHTCATVYAIAEKAADLIKARAGSSTTTTSGSSTSTSTTTTTTTTSTSTSTSTTTTTTTTTTSTSTSTSTGNGCTVAKWGQCDGQTYTGCKTCAAGSTCTYSNPWYSQCL